ncbi:hypothetical protein ACLB1Q_27800 [Escherichia coli]
MTLTMCLSLRSSWLNKVLGGLDKAWRLHKWQEYAPSLLLSPHWLDEKLPVFVTLAGLLTLVK